VAAAVLAIVGGAASCAKPRYVQAVQASAPWTELSTAHFDGIARHELAHT